MQYAIIKTDWGPFGFVARKGRLVATFLSRGETTIRRTIGERYPEATESRELLPGFQDEVKAYFAGQRRRFSIGLELSEQTPFRQAVLDACRRIPYGKTATYADLARAAGRPGAARAVGSTMANNPLPLVVPCHRVVRADGSLGGFSSPNGVKEKRRLLALEGVTI
ncbi:MAG: methylated-DNA--[protein]-cysteine S-methyltransferase [Phycisphaerae bacterium]|jgi:methylated-DNA-[protein]-cysteine S-methyltransferase